MDLFGKKEIIDKINECIDVIDGLKSELYETTVDCIQILNTKNILANRIIDERDEKITSLKDELEESRQEIADLTENNKAQIKSFDFQLKEYEELIEKLHKENETLDKIRQEQENTIKLLKQTLDSEKDKSEYYQNLDVSLKKLEQYYFQLVRDSTEKTNIIESVTGSLEMLAQGLYEQDNVEIALLKTYRGWKYICYNGQSITDFSNVKSVKLEQEGAERVVLEIVKDGE